MGVLCAFYGHFQGQFPNMGGKGVILDVNWLKITQKHTFSCQNHSNSTQIRIYTHLRGGFVKMFSKFVEFCQNVRQK